MMFSASPGNSGAGAEGGAAGTGARGPFCDTRGFVVTTPGPERRTSRTVDRVGPGFVSFFWSRVARAGSLRTALLLVAPTVPRTGSLRVLSLEARLSWLLALEGTSRSCVVTTGLRRHGRCCRRCSPSSRRAGGVRPGNSTRTTLSPGAAGCHTSRAQAGAAGSPGGGCSTKSSRRPTPSFSKRTVGHEGCGPRCSGRGTMPRLRSRLRAHTASSSPPRNRDAASRAFRNTTPSAGDSSRRSRSSCCPCGPAAASRSASLRRSRLLRPGRLSAPAWVTSTASTRSRWRTSFQKLDLGLEPPFTSTVKPLTAKKAASPKPPGNT